MGWSRGAVTAVLAALLVLAVLGILVAAEVPGLLRLDGSVSRALYAGDDRSAGLDRLLHVLTAPGLSWFRTLVLLPALIWSALRARWRQALWVLLAGWLIGPVTSGLKEVVGRARPPFSGGGLHYSGLSFPSGHSSGVATLVTVLLVLAWPRLSPLARRWSLAGGIALALLVGLTRMWLGVHYLADVVGGLSLGVAWSLGLALLLGVVVDRRAVPASR